MLTVKSILWEKCPPDLQICFSGIWCHITFLLFNKCQRILCAAQQDTKPNSQEKFFFFFTDVTICHFMLFMCKM